MCNSAEYGHFILTCLDNASPSNRFIFKSNKSHLGFDGREKPEYLKKNLSETGREPKTLGTLHNREFKKHRRWLQRKCHNKIELCVRLSTLGLLHIGPTLYKTGELHFRLVGTNGFHVKASNERFSTAVSRCPQNPEYDNFTLSFGRPRQKIAPKSVPHVQHDLFPHSTNQIIDLCRCRRHFLNSQMTTPTAART